MHTISKQFSFCYGHRVWTQKLDKELSCNVPCACRHLHGHQGEIMVGLSSETLQDGMVTDFHHLNWFKKWLDVNFDHKMILDKNDPVLPHLLSGVFTLPSDYGWLLNDVEEERHRIYQPELFKKPYSQFLTPDLNTVYKTSAGATYDLLEGLVLVGFTPTSENLSKFFWHVIFHKFQKTFLDDRIIVDHVIFQETPKSSAMFRFPHQINPVIEG